MPRRDIEFTTGDNVILRGWFYTPAASGQASKVPCIVMSHGFSALKEMDLDAFAEHFSSHLPVSCLVYDNRGFGTSDQRPGQPRQEIIPSEQVSDIRDAITHAQTLPEVDPAKIGIWGSSYSGGHVLAVAAVDRRVKAVISQAPLVNGMLNFQRLIRPDFVAGVLGLIEADRLGRAAGNAPMTLPVVDADPLKTSALPTADSYTFFSEWEKKAGWKNEVTVRSMDMLRSNIPDYLVDFIAPTPLLMVVAENDVLTPTDLALRTYAKALEPKQLVMLPGGHFEAYTGPNFAFSAGSQTEFLRKTLCK